MPPFLDITGMMFGRLTALKLVGKTPAGMSLWLCACECGNKRVVMVSSLRYGSTTSCGCIRVEQQRKSFLRHGMSGTREHHTWLSMLQRCYNENNPRYEHYGGRGISVCDEWRDDFAAFYRDMGPKPIGLSIDRIDNDGDYNRDNCRWATASEQNYNTRRSRRTRPA